MYGRGAYIRVWFVCVRFFSFVEKRQKNMYARLGLLLLFCSGKMRLQQERTKIRGWLDLFLTQGVRAVIVWPTMRREHVGLFSRFSRFRREDRSSLKSTEKRRTDLLKTSDEGGWVG